MTELLSIAQMRAVEAAAFAGGAESRAVMERAGRETVAAVLAHWPDLAQGAPHAVVLCGPGNNGGDGFVIARALRERGWRVEVLFLGDRDRLGADAAAMHDLWAAEDAVVPLSVAAADAGERPDLLVDALFGIGVARPLADEVCAAWAAVGRRARGARRCRVVAVDCPSGLDGDTGRVRTPAAPSGPRGETEDGGDDARHAAIMARMLRADLTVTGHKPKLGHYLALGPALCGTLAVRDIGIGAWDAEEASPLSRPGPERVRLVGTGPRGEALPGRIWPGHLLRPMGHKYDRGHVLVLAGGVGRGGAARMAARAALRVGAGLVTVGCPPAALIENAARLDAIMLRSVADWQALADLLGDARISGLCLGPGLGASEEKGERTRALVAAALEAERATVLDADALTAFAGEPETLFGLLHRDCVLTPHEGEFARLFPDLGRRGREGSKVEAARAAADRAGCTVLLKGPDTVIASPGGAASVHAAAHGREAPWLGTAGAGDVLAGLIAGLAARPHGVDVHCAAEAAAWLHVEAARAAGPGLIAEDLPEALPGAFRALGL